MSETASHNHHAFDYIEIPVTDLEVGEKFYAFAFGWHFNDYGPDYKGIRRMGEPGEMGGLCRAESLQAKGGRILVILYSKVLEDTAARVTAAGGKITMPIFDFPGGRRFHFEDPSGNELGVWSEK